MTSASTFCSSTSNNCAIRHRTQNGTFQSEYAGKLNFYVALVDDKLRREVRNDAVGILICGRKNDHTVRYALGRSESPMAVFTHTYENPPATKQPALLAADELTAAFDQIVFGSTG